MGTNTRIFTVKAEVAVFRGSSTPRARAWAIGSPRRAAIEKWCAAIDAFRFGQGPLCARWKGAKGISHRRQSRVRGISAARELVSAQAIRRGSVFCQEGSCLPVPRRASRAASRGGRRVDGAIAAREAAAVPRRGCPRARISREKAILGVLPRGQAAPPAATDGACSLLHFMTRPKRAWYASPSILWAIALSSTATMS